MTKLQTIKRFASKTEGMNFTEVFEDSNCKQVDVTTAKYTVRITAYSGVQILGVAIYTNGELVFKRSAESQKEAVQFIENHVDRIVDEYIEENTVVSEDDLTGEDMLYRALRQFSAFEISAEQCLSLIYKALDKAQNKEERDNIKEYAILFAERIASGYYKSANESAEEVVETDYDEVIARFNINGECKQELNYTDIHIKISSVKSDLECIYKDYVKDVGLVSGELS